MEQPAFNYDEFRRSMVRQKVEEQIQFYERLPKDAPFVESYLEYLRNRLGGTFKVVPDRPLFSYDRRGNRFEITKFDQEEFNKDMEKVTYGIPWAKMKEYHKINKIKEFVNNLEYKKNQKGVDTNKKKIATELIKGLENKKFQSGGSIIEYDKTQMKIISISCCRKLKNGLYEIDWDY